MANKQTGRKKRIRSYVKRLKLQQQQNPMSKKEYQKKLRVAKRKDFFRRFWTVILILGIVFVVLIFAGLKMFERMTGQTLQACMEDARQIVQESKPEDFRFAQTSYIYSENGTELAALSEDTDATYLEYDQIPQDVINAFVAIEDRSFWTNSGIDYRGILRAGWTYLRTRGERAEGASTITQQLARGQFLTNEKSIARKVKEIFIARELAQKYSKEQIMEFYCNTCCFANGIYGVEDAAQAYFERPVDELSLSEIAYICAIPNRPEYYNPLKNSENAVTRRDKILQDMFECGYITRDAGEYALAEPVSIVEPEEDREFYNYEVTYAIDCAVRYFMKLDGFAFQYDFESDEDYNTYNDRYDEAYQQAKHKLYTGGYHVTTTIDLQAQDSLQRILNEDLAFSETVKEDSGVYELQGALTVIDNESGKVVAIIGGRKQEETSQTYSLNRAYQGYAQPGSSFKPLAVYTPALEQEKYTPSSQLKDIDVDEAKESTSEKIREMSGEQMSLRTAVEKSRNGCAYWLFNEITPRNGLSYVTQMNFTRIVPEDFTLSASLGGLTHGVSTVEMANAYSTLENHGQYRQTDCIASILDASGEEVYEDPQVKTVYSRPAADAMTDIMTGVLENGTARRLGWSGETDIEAAGKTGTTNDNKAGWFCGYTPYYTIAVWVGCDTPKEVDGLEGGTYPATIWKDAMLYMISGMPEAGFELDDTVLNREDTSDGDEEEVLEETVPEEILPEEIVPEEQMPQQPEIDVPGSVDPNTPAVNPNTPATDPNTPPENTNPSDPNSPATDPNTPPENTNPSDAGSGETDGGGTVQPQSDLPAA